MPKEKETAKNTYEIMPNSIEAEQNVLCCIMKDTAIQTKIISQLTADDFYQPNHKLIFEAMKEVSVGYHKEGGIDISNTVNFATVVDQLRRNGNLTKVGDIDYIIRINDCLPGTARYDEYVAIVRRASIMRKLINLCGDIEQKAYSSATAEEALEFAESRIFQLSQHGNVGNLVPLGDVTATTLNKISQRFQHPGMFKGVESGIRQLDRLTNGFHGSELIVLAARPGVGKSAMAMNIVENVAKQGKTVAVFSLEMSNEQLIERMLSSMSAVPMEYIKNGQLPNGDEDLRKLRDAQDIICSKMKIYGNDYANIRPSEIISQCRQLKETKGLDLIVIDYIQLMSSDLQNTRESSRTLEVGQITRSLKLLAKQLNVPVIALAQLKRDAEIRNIKGDKAAGSSEPVLSDLRESGSIEQDADIVLFIHKDKDATSGEINYSLIVAKHRNGEQAKIPLHWIGKIVRFVDDEYLVQHNMQASTVEPEEPEQDSVVMNEQDEEDLVAPPVDE